MTDKRFMVIHLGNPVEFVVKDLVENRTYGVFKGDGESMKKLCDDLDKLHEENQELKQFKGQVFDEINKRIITLQTNSEYCHKSGKHEKGIEFTQQADLLKRLKKELRE